MSLVKTKNQLLPLENFNSGAEFSPDQQFRYVLWRMWDSSKPMVMFIGLNPSTANELTDDPTIRRVKKFAFDMGYGGVFMCNLFAYVSTDPSALLVDKHLKVGQHNDRTLMNYAATSKQIIFCWGGFDTGGRDMEVIKMFPEANCLSINRDGTPGHPLYLKSTLRPMHYRDSVKKLNLPLLNHLYIS